MSRWQDAFRIGQVVELLIFERWERGVIIKLSQTHMPTVRLEGGSVLYADRKDWIRPCTTEGKKTTRPR